MKLIRIKTHDAVNKNVTYECDGGTMPKAVPFKRNQPDLVNVIIPTEVLYLDMGDRAQKIIPGEHVLIADPASGRLSIMLQQVLDKDYSPVE